MKLKNIFKHIANYPSERRFRKLKERAESGDSSAYRELADCYANGEGTKRNYKNALKWYRLQAETGRPYVKYEFGLRYLNGDKVVKETDRDEAIKWFERSAAEGCKPAEDILLEFGIIKGKTAKAKVSVTDSPKQVVDKVVTKKPSEPTVAPVERKNEATTPKTPKVVEPNEYEDIDEVYDAYVNDGDIDAEEVIASLDNIMGFNDFFDMSECYEKFREQKDVAGLLADKILEKYDTCEELRELEELYDNFYKFEEFRKPLHACLVSYMEDYDLEGFEDDYKSVYNEELKKEIVEYFNNSSDTFESAELSDLKFLSTILNGEARSGVLFRNFEIEWYNNENMAAAIDIYMDPDYEVMSDEDVIISDALYDMEPSDGIKLLEGCKNLGESNDRQKEIWNFLSDMYFAEGDRWETAGKMKKAEEYYQSAAEMGNEKAIARLKELHP